MDVLEEAGRKISRREQASGPIERLHGYLWVALRTIAVSRLRRGSARLTQRTLPSEEGQAALEATPSILGSADEIERRILLRQVLNMLSPEERLVCAWKRAGFSSHEIARRRGGTAAAIDKMLSRARERVRRNSAVSAATMTARVSRTSATAPTGQAGRHLRIAEPYL